MEYFSWKEFTDVKFPLEKVDTKEYGTFKASHLKMDLEVYKNDILGNISQLHGKAPLGLMDMETIIFTCVNKDLPLFNVDRIEVGGKQTLIIELYDTQLRHSSFDQSGFIKAKASLADLNNYEHNAHWYDYLRMDCSIAKKGSKSDFKRFDNTIRECLLSYLRQAESLPELSAEEKKLKKEKACEYMNNLVEKGGTASDGFIKSFGKEKTRSLFEDYIFGVKND